LLCYGRLAMPRVTIQVLRTEVTSRMTTPSAHSALAKGASSAKAAADAMINVKDASGTATCQMIRFESHHPV
jgi:hypothetical protein